MGEVAIDCLAAQDGNIFAFCSLCQVKSFALVSPSALDLSGMAGSSVKNPSSDQHPSKNVADILKDQSPGGVALAEVGILIVDDDVVSQRALKNILDSEGWRVRVVPLASAAMLELASGEWSLVIVNVAMTDVRGPLFNILKDLAQGAADAPDEAVVDEARPKRIRVLFLVPLLAVGHAQPVLEQESLPYLAKPYHLHDFLGKVSELLVETGSLVEPIRTIGDFSVTSRRQQGARAARNRRSSMFASRDDYQMSEDELIEWERSEEEERKKREKEIWDREHL
jgi:CheY-like chemotaxis protein